MVGDFAGTEPTVVMFDFLADETSYQTPVMSYGGTNLTGQAGRLPEVPPIVQTVVGGGGRAGGKESVAE